MSDRIIRRSGSADSRVKSTKNFSKVGDMRVEYNQCKHQVEKLEEALSFEKQRLQHAAKSLEDARDQLSQFQEQIDCDPLPEGAQPRARIQQRDMMILNVAQLENAYRAQKIASDKAFDNLNEAEKKYFQTDKALVRYIKTLEDAQEALTLQVELDKDRSIRLAKQEERRAKRWEKEQKLALEARASQIEDLYQKGTEQIHNAKILHHDASLRITKALDYSKSVVDEINAAKENHLNERTEAVLELKTNLNAVRTQVATQAEKYNRKVTFAKQQLENEKDGMLAKGLNPYVEFRRKELDAEARGREKRMQSAVEENKTNLAENLVREEESRQRVLATKHKSEMYEKKHRAEQGRNLIEKKNQQYMKSVTSNGQDILDPSGRSSRIDPSQVTDIPDYSFGLGKSSRQPDDNRKRIIDKIRVNLGVDETNYGEYDRLVKGLVDDSSPTASSTTKDTPASDEQPSSVKELDALAPDVASRGVPGVGIAATEVNLGEEKTELLQLVQEQNGVAVNVDNEDGSSSPKYKQRELSKFEVDALAKNRSKHRDRIELGVEQVAAGKVFHGDSFVPKPAELLFKDFEVGKVYKKVFTMTNSSYTFNSFKVLDLTDDIIDFFTVTYERPGRVSAGVSCSIQIVFSPQVNQDIVSHLRFLTETGPVEVPLVCLIKRCAPLITNPNVDFGSGVIGQQFSLPLHIKNTEAMGTKFFVHRLGDSSNTKPNEEDSQETEHVATPRELENPFGCSEPAGGEGELQARVRRVMTQVFREKKKADPFPLSFPVAEGYVPGYGETTINVRYAPLVVGHVHNQFVVTFEKVDEKLGLEWSKPTLNANGDLVKKEQLVTVTAVAEDVPIYIADETMNMKCTLFERVYRKQLELRNRGRSAYRVNISIHPLFQKFVEISPTMLFVQAQSAQTVNVKFSPTESLIRMATQFSLPFANFLNAALMMLPIEIQVVNQELPVYFILKSEVCPSGLKISTTSLDFGKLYVNQRSTMPLTVTNVSMIPQKIAFVHVKKEVTVEPNEGFAVLLPNESLQFNIKFSPQSAISYDFNMELLSSVNDRYTVHLSAIGEDCPCHFEVNCVALRTTFPGERVIDSLIVKNASSSRQVLEIRAPEFDYCWLKVSPSVLDLTPGGSARVEVEFFPPQGLHELNPMEWQQKLRSVDDGKVDNNNSVAFEQVEVNDGWMLAKNDFGEVQWTMNDQVEGDTREDQSSLENEGDGFPSVLPEEEWGIFGTWNLPIFFKPKVKVGSLNSALPMFFRIETAVTLPQIDASAKVVDFGQMALGTRQIKTFKIFNRGFAPMTLISKPFNAVGPFTMLNSVRTIEPGASHQVIIECLPVRPGLNVEILEFVPADNVGGHQLRITVRTQGVKPAIELSGLSPPPPTWNSRCGILDFGNLVASDKCTMSFSITNNSSFAVETSILRSACIGLTPARQAELIERTLEGLPVFSYRPEKARIAPGSSQVIQVVFRPDKERFVPYREDLEVIVGKTDETLRVGLFGRSWNRQLFVTTGDPSDEPFNQDLNTFCPPVEDSTAIHPVVDVRVTAKEVLHEVLGLTRPAKPQIRLEFPDPFSSSADPSSYVEIDNTAPAPSAKGGKSAPPPVNSALIGARKQVRKLSVVSAKFFDGRAAPAGGTFEIILDKATVDSGLFVVTPDKGPVNAGTQTSVEIVCTLPKPRGLGGLSVGSWQLFRGQIVLKGGWTPQGESDEIRIPIELRTFVSL